MNNILIIIKKELKRVFGDRKMITSLYVTPAVIVILIYSLMGNMIGNMESDIIEHEPTVTVVNPTEGLKQAIEATYEGKASVQYITEEEYNLSKESLDNKILEGEEDLVVYLSPEFENQVAGFENAGAEIPEMEIIYNSTENYSTQAYSVFSQYVAPNYQNDILSKRFENMGVLTAFNQKPQTIYKEEKANAQFLSMMLPYLVVMMLYAGVMAIGVDAIAGEKERGTLSSMLISPAKRIEIVVGKLVSMAILSGLSAVVYCVSMIVALTMMGSSNEAVGIELGIGAVSFSPVQIIELLLTMFVLVYFYVGIVGFLATISKNTKSASSLVSPVYIVVVVLGVMTMFTSGKTIPGYRYLIPIYGNALAIKDICSNELLTANFLLSMVGTLACGIILTLAIAKAFNSEKIMFNA